MESLRSLRRGCAMCKLPWIRFTSVVIFLAALDSLVCMVLWFAGGSSSYLEHSVRDFSFSHSTFDLAVLAVARGLVLVPCLYYLEHYSLLTVSARGKKRKQSALHVSRLCRAGIFIVAIVSVIYVIVKGSYIISQIQRGRWDSVDPDIRMHVTYRILCIVSLIFPLLEIGVGVASWYFLGRMVHEQRLRLLVNAENGEEEEEKEEEDGEKKRKVNLKRLALLAKPVRKLVTTLWHVRLHKVA